VGEAHSARTKSERSNPARTRLAEIRNEIRARTSRAPTNQETASRVRACLGRSSEFGVRSLAFELRLGSVLSVPSVVQPDWADWFLRLLRLFAAIPGSEFCVPLARLCGQPRLCSWPIQKGHARTLDTVAPVGARQGLQLTFCRRIQRRPRRRPLPSERFICPWAAGYFRTWVR
jgi:hypothetical protein